MVQGFWGFGVNRFIPTTIAMPTIITPKPLKEVVVDRFFDLLNLLVNYCHDLSKLF